MEHFDAIVIGAGQAGVPLARDLAGAGRSVAIIERAHVGGSCINEGCTPTKTMVASARVAHLATRAPDYGVRVGGVSVDLERVRERKRQIVDSFREGNETRLREQDNVELIMGEARFLDARHVTVALNAGGERKLGGESFFLNVGTRARLPTLEGLAAVPYLDNVSVMELAEVPEHLLVIGGGYVGVEFAQMFRRFGSEVTVVQAADRLLHREDDDVTDAIRTILEEDGIDVLTAADAKRVAAGPLGLRLDVAVQGEQRQLDASHVLIAVGRVPNSDALDLAAAGVRTDEEGYVEVDDHLRTSVEGIYALGDVKGGPAFTHVSYDDYRIVRADLLGEGRAHSTQDRLLPYTVFIDPQLGRVGMSERQARAADVPYRTLKLPMANVARAIETGETRGFMKALVSPDDGALLGAAILATEGGELASMLQLAMLGGLRASDLRDAVLTHPLYAEAFNNLFA